MIAVAAANNSRCCCRCFFQVAAAAVAVVNPAIADVVVVYVQVRSILLLSLNSSIQKETNIYEFTKHAIMIDRIMNPTIQVHLRKHTETVKQTTSKNQIQILGYGHNQHNQPTNIWIGNWMLTRGTGN